jgi:hypothetical protein
VVAAEVALDTAGGVGAAVEGAAAGTDRRPILRSVSQATLPAADPPTRSETADLRPCWSDRMFAATRIEPAWIGAAIAVVGLTLAAIGAVISGRMALVVELGPAVLFTGRDPRNLIVFVIMFAYVVTARRYVLLGGLRAFDALGPVLVAQPGLELESLRSETVERPTDARVRRRRALMTLAIAPLVAFAIDRDPSLYFLPEYWNYERTAQWGAGLALCWNLGLLIDATLECGRRFDSLARRLERVDLLRLDLLAPFADLGMRIALVWLLIAALFALNLVDVGYLSSVIALAVLSLGLATAGVLPPVLGARAGRQARGTRTHQARPQRRSQSPARQHARGTRRDSEHL